MRSSGTVGLGPSAREVPVGRIDGRTPMPMEELGMEKETCGTSRTAFVLRDCPPLLFGVWPADVRGGTACDPRGVSVARDACLSSAPDACRPNVRREAAGALAPLTSLAPLESPGRAGVRPTPPAAPRCVLLDKGACPRVVARDGVGEDTAVSCAREGRPIEILPVEAGSSVLSSLRAAVRLLLASAMRRARSA